MKSNPHLFLIFVLAFATLNVAAQQTDLDLGVEQYGKGNYAHAIAPLKRATKKTAKSDARAWYYLGLTYTKLDKNKDALKAFLKAVKLDGKSDAFRTALAYQYLIKNDRKATSEAQAALAINPNNSEAHYILGVRSLKNESYDAAYERAKKAIELNPDLTAAYLLKSEALVSSFVIQRRTVVRSRSNLGEFLKEAIEALETFLRLAPADEEAKFQREYIVSLRFFSEYYSRPENQKPVNFDVVQPGDTGVNNAPLKLISKPSAPYTEAARNAGISGTVRLLVGFSEDATVKHVLVAKPLSHGLTQSAVRSARQIKFQPPTKDGKPVSTVRVVEYVFHIF